MNKDQIYMNEALKEANKAAELDEIPIGAIIVYKKEIIARSHNQICLLKDPTAHAEIIAITQAANYLKNERLINCTLYVTIEPCSMCAGALVLARINRLVYGASDSKSGACGSIIDIINHPKLNHKVKVKRQVLGQECAALLKDFFKSKRNQSFITK